MGRSRRKNGRVKTGKEFTCPENGREKRRGRKSMRWEDCIERDMGRVGGEWRTTAKDRDRS